MADMANNSGGWIGVQKLGRVALNYGANIPIVANSQGYEEENITTESVRYDDRFDDVGYYE